MLKDYIRFCCFVADAFISEDSGEVREALKELNCPQFHDAFVARAVRASLDHGLDKQKWMSKYWEYWDYLYGDFIGIVWTSGEVLTILCDSKVISTSAANRGFEKLVQQAEDIKLVCLVLI